MAMRKIAGILVVTAAIGLSTAPLVRAQDQNDSSTSSPPGHVQQHQERMPSFPAQKDQKDSNQSTRDRSTHDPSAPDQSAPDQSAPDQSAQAPQSPAVITPPSTGDKSVITPPATGAAKMPVIKPPGAPGNKDDIQPK
jgi:hypothetical protein